MTLIIGSISKDFGLIAGDTQLTTIGLEREGKIRKNIELKVRRYSSDLMFGILGKWGYFLTDKESKGLARYYNDYDLLTAELFRKNSKNKFDYLKKFLKGRDYIDASVVYVKRKEDGFELDAITNRDKEDHLRINKINGVDFLFNEPFLKTDDTYVNSKIEKIINDNKLSNSLVDTLFVLNNVILSIISNGRSFTISKNDVSYTGIDNTVGGYLTIQIMTKSGIHSLNYLGSPYHLDKSCLMDRTTNPFSNYLDKNPIIRYIDNLGMLIKNIDGGQIDALVKSTIQDLIPKQMCHINSLEIISTDVLNQIIDFINQKYDLGIEPFEIQEAKDDLDCFINFFQNEEEQKVDLNFLLRFL